MILNVVKHTTKSFNGVHQIATSSIWSKAKGRHPRWSLDHQLEVQQMQLRNLTKRVQCSAGYAAVEVSAVKVQPRHLEFAALQTSQILGACNHHLHLQHPKQPKVATAKLYGYQVITYQYLSAMAYSLKWHWSHDEITESSWDAQGRRVPCGFGHRRRFVWREAPGSQPTRRAVQKSHLRNWHRPRWSLAGPWMWRGCKDSLPKLKVFKTLDYLWLLYILYILKISSKS